MVIFISEQIYNKVSIPANKVVSLNYTKTWLGYGIYLVTNIDTVYCGSCYSEDVSQPIRSFWELVAKYDSTPELVYIAYDSIKSIFIQVDEEYIIKEFNSDDYYFEDEEL